MPWACQTALAILNLRVTEWAEVNGECINGDMGVQTYHHALQEHQGEVGPSWASFCLSLQGSALCEGYSNHCVTSSESACCCILRGSSGKRIVDVVPGGMELEPHVKNGSWAGRTDSQ